jgi:uncharacterized oxidoreductase
MNLAGKLALVTGGTDGIGLEISSQLSSKGCKVIVAGRRAELLDRARSRGFEAIAADLSSPKGCRELIDALAAQPLDILVNNAGADPEFNIDRPIDLDVNDKAIFLNLNAPIHLIAGLISMLKSRPSATIVNVTSGYAVAPSAQTPVYSATKAGLRSFTMALRAQLAKTKITVIEALPPLVDTALTRDIALPGKMPAADCAAAIVQAIIQGKHEANIGQVKSLRLVESISPALARRIMLKN